MALFRKTVLFLVGSLPIMLMGQWNTTNYFNKSYDFQYIVDIVDKVIVTDSGYFIFGDSGWPVSMLLLMETDSSGNIIWEQYFGDGIHDYRNSTAIVYKNQGYYLGGLKESQINGKYLWWYGYSNKKGIVQWEKVFGDTMESQGLFDIIYTADSNLLLIGNAQRNNGNDSQFRLVKCQLDGSVIWEKQYGNSLWEVAFDGLLCDDGGFLICGYRHNVPAGDRDILLIRTDSLGNELWEKTYGGDYRDWGGHITKSLEGGYLIAGLKQTYKDLLNFNDEYRGWLIKIDDSGNEQWSKLYQYLNYRKNSLEDGIIQLSDSSYVSIGGVKDNASKKDRAWIVKTDRFGKVIWSRTYTRNPSKHHYFYDFKPTPDGGFIVCGTTWNQSQDAWLVKLDSFGCDTPGCQIYDAVQNIPAPKAGLNIYPNPSTGIIHISFPSLQSEARAILFNALGQAVLEKKLVAGSAKLNLDLSLLPRACYVLQVESAEQVYTAKVLVE